MKLAVIFLLLCPASVFAAEPAKLLQLHVGDKTLTGRIAAKDAERVWLLQRDGRIDDVAIADVADYQPLAGAFRPLSSTELRDGLIKEFGRGYDVASTSHYLVVAGRGQAKRFAGLFEELYRHVHVYLAARNFRIREPEFPLLAVVLPDQAQFAAYCQRENVKPSPGLRGFYLQSSNRVALYDTGDGDFDDTIIHEAVHQVAFNLGLHRRIGADPLWVIEGLATTFEPENFRKPLPSTPLSAKINRERYLHFRNYLERRPAKSLEDFIASDDLFKSATLDGYAQAWALTFFLMETRQQQYAQYLKAIASRPPLEAYVGDARLEDFQQVFGKNLVPLESDFLRFISALNR